MPSTAQCVGVTTFIKTELIADGVGRAHVPRIGGARCGLSNGQRVDNELRKWIVEGAQGPLKHAGSRHVAAGLARLGIKPLKAQVRVTDADLQITTLIDAVGEGPNDTLWVVEIKTTTLNSANHIKSYSRVCQRTPVMRNGVTHTEQATHFLQAAFGALTLRSFYAVHPDVNIKACVIVATADACRTYVCPDGFMHRKLFHRRHSVPLSVVGSRRQTKRNAKPPLASKSVQDVTAPWPEKDSPEERHIDAVLRRMKLMRAPGGRQRRAVWRVHQIVRGQRGKPVGILALIPKDLHRMHPKHRRALTEKLTLAARRLLTSAPSLPFAARLTISARTYGVAPCPGPLGRV